ncbi:F-box only protein 6 [Selaginella moellendorffii]|nr:F-box only protein 6 [Selaginella moellendorffii]|eukprot:XP_002991992.2 F-box only protein 6 [Selaginella moellendorffii]
MILAKLPLDDLLRSRAVCKFWRRISTTKSFLRRYDMVIGAKPWLLFMLARNGFVFGMDVLSGKPRGFFREPRNPWIPTTPDTSIVSCSLGLLLLQDKHGHFTVVNPFTKETKKLPSLDMSSGEEIVYSGMQCSHSASSYKVFTMGVMDADEISGLLYEVSVVQPVDLPILVPDIREYKQPFMRVYCSETGSWTSITRFPAGFVLPFHLLFKAHQSFIANSVLYCTTNVNNLPGKIARFDIAKLEWIPTLVDIPEDLMVMSFMVDSDGEPMVIVVDKNMSKFSKAVIEQDKLVITEELQVPREILPTNGLMFGMMDVWGFGHALLLYIPVQKSNAWDLKKWDGRSLMYKGNNIKEEPTIQCWFVSLHNSTVYFQCLPEPHLPIGAFVTGAADVLKLVYSPSLRRP